MGRIYPGHHHAHRGHKGPHPGAVGKPHHHAGHPGYKGPHHGRGHHAGHSHRSATNIHHSPHYQGGSNNESARTKALHRNPTYNLAAERHHHNNPHLGQHRHVVTNRHLHEKYAPYYQPPDINHRL